VRNLDVKEKLRKIVIEDLKLDLFGVAPIDRFSHAPKDHHPESLLPGARSVISIGAIILEGVRRANIRFHYEKAPRHLLYSYLWYGYSILNWMVLDHAAYVVAKELEKAGYASLPVPSSGSELVVREEGKKLFGQFSHRHAAVAAGLGEFGLSGLVLNPLTGPRARWVSVITVAELDPDPLYEGPTLCDVKRCEELCVRKFGVAKPICHYVCPVGAFITEHVRTVRIGGKTYRYPDLDVVKCLWVGAGHVGDKVGIPESVKTIYDVWKEPLDPLVQRELLFAHRAHYCGRCLTMCPSPNFQVPE